MSVAFDFGFGIFLLLMAVLVVFVVRFALRVGRRRPQAGSSDPPAGAAAGQGRELG